MANEEKQLFSVKTRGCGTFHVVATSFDAAAKAVSDELNSQDYGYSGDRRIMQVEHVCTEQWMKDGRRALYGDGDENHLIVCHEYTRKHCYVRKQFKKGEFDGDDAEAVQIVKRIAIDKVAEMLGRMLIRSEWAYLKEGLSDDGVWLEAGMYVDELPEEVRHLTEMRFLGIKADEHPDGQ
jgi:hypothetical protein